MIRSFAPDAADIEPHVTMLARPFLRPLVMVWEAQPGNPLRVVLRSARRATRPPVRPSALHWHRGRVCGRHELAGIAASAK